MDTSRRSKPHKESLKREKKSITGGSKEHHHNQQQPQHSNRKQGPRFGNLIPRNNELKSYATSVLGDFHSTVETIRQDQTGLMGVDRSLPITPLTSGVNPFPQLVQERAHLQAKAPPTSSLIKSIDERHKPHPPTHPLKEGDDSIHKNVKKRKKEKHEMNRNKSDPFNNEHAQFDNPPKFAKSFSEEERDRKRLKKSHKEQQITSELESGHVITSHVTSENSFFANKPNKLVIDTSSLDATDLQSIKDLINLPPFITPINTPHNTNNPFVFPPTSSNNTSQQNTSSLTSSHQQHEHNSRSFATLSSSNQAPPVSMATDILGNISSSDDDSSSDSEEEDEDEEEEEEREGEKPDLYSENTASMLEHIRRDFHPSSLNTITPMKTSPHSLPHPLSLNDESANLSPAKFRTNQQVAPPTNAMSSLSDSESSSSDTDSEEDDENEVSENENDESTRPFDVNYTQRQTSKPFTYEPDDLSPISTSKGQRSDAFSHAPSHTHQSSHTHNSSNKKRRHSERSFSNKKIRLSDANTFVEENRRPHPQGGVTQLVVQIPLSKVPDLQQKSKPQATVGPYLISSDHHKRTARGSQSEPSLGNSAGGSGRREGRRQEDSGSYYHGDHTRERWDPVSPSSSNRGSSSKEEYWTNSNTSTHQERSKQYTPQYYFDRAKILKREADSIPTNHGITKATRYMEAVTFFMRHGHTQEIEASNSRPYKIYADIINMIKYCSKLGNDCLPLVIICLRCQAVLLWRMYMIKQAHLYQLQKELQDVFNTSSKVHQKSPVSNFGNFSPLPSPASVGSTASSCSGPSSFSSSDQPLAISRQIGSKVMEYISLTSHVQQGIDLWRQSDGLSDRSHDFFNSVNRKIGVLSQFSSVPLVADWMEQALQLVTKNLH